MTALPGRPPADTVSMFCNYRGYIVTGRYDLKTGRATIVAGEGRLNRLKGCIHASPSGAAKAVIRQLGHSASGARNGWDFWIIADGSGRRLSAVRPSRPRRRVVSLPPTR